MGVNSNDFLRSKTEKAAEDKQTIDRASSSLDEIKDRIIQNLRNEIRDHQAHERDYTHLQSLLVDLERRASNLRTSINEGRAEHENTLAGQDQTIKHHKNDIETLKQECVVKMKEGSDLQDHIKEEDRNNSDAQSQIYLTRRDLEHMQASNDGFKRDIEVLQRDLAEQHERKQQFAQQIYQLRNDSSFKDKQIEKERSNLSMLNKEVERLHDRQVNLQASLDDKSVAYERTS